MTVCEPSSGSSGKALRRDGYDVDEPTGRINPTGPRFGIQSLARVSDPSAMRAQFDRIRQVVSDDDAALAVSSAKELIESTAELVLLERGQLC